MLKKIIQLTGKKIRTIAKSGKKQSISLFQNKAKQVSEVAPLTARKNEVSEPEIAKVAEERRPQRRHKSRRRPKKRWNVEDFQVEPKEGMVRFHDLELPRGIMHAIADLDFQYCTPIQAKALPELLKGKDIIGRASTGTGKTAVFLISVFSSLLNKNKRSKRKGAPHALIIAPTRELVMQIAKDGTELLKYSPLRIVSVYGGVDYGKQMKFLSENICDVIVATPGRLLDYIGKGVVKLDGCEIMVIDEADRMLDMGFIPDVRRIIYKIKQRKQRQTMLFSATVTDDVQRLAAQWCTEPVFVEIEPERVAVETVTQVVYLVTTEEKYAVLYNLIQAKPEDRILVFANQKNEAKKLLERLQRNGIRCTLLSGDVPQRKRMGRLEDFRSGKIKILVATDVAGRGIHIDNISHVVNFTLPYEPEDYVHRIGRTGRAGAEGISISFACEEGAFQLPDIEEFIGQKIECVVPGEELLVKPPKGRRPRVENKGGASRKGGKKGGSSRGRRKYTGSRSQSVKKKDE